MKRFGVAMGWVALGLIETEGDSCSTAWEWVARAVLDAQAHALRGWLSWHAAQDYVGAA